jgi:hypothetical protein
MKDEAPIVYSEVRGAPLGGASAIFLYGDLARGDPVLLFREPTNPDDPNAIKVLDFDCEGFVGYIAREKAAIMAPLIDAGWVYTAKVTVPAEVRHIRGHRFTKKNSLEVKCTPLPPMRQKKETKASVPIRRELIGIDD